MTTLGENIRRAREKAKLTQAQLAERAELHSVTISELERGTSPDWKWSTVQKLGKALRIDPLELLPHKAPAK